MTSVDSERDVDTHIKRYAETGKQMVNVEIRVVNSIIQSHVNYS